MDEYCRSKWFNQYTVTDLEEKKKEFDRIIQEMAEGHVNQRDDGTGLWIGKR